MEILKTHAVHGGTLRYLRHDSATTGTPMTLSVFTPPGEGPFPVLIWLSGLTCTEDNFTTKAGAYAAAVGHGVIIVAPDTSPRGEGVADDPAYDLGQGAGFYVDATQEPPGRRISAWNPMSSGELIAPDRRRVPDDENVRAISGPFDGRAWRPDPGAETSATCSARSRPLRPSCRRRGRAVGREGLQRLSG